MSAWRGRRGAEVGTLLTHSLNPSGAAAHRGARNQSDRRERLHSGRGNVSVSHRGSAGGPGLRAES